MDSEYFKALYQLRTYHEVIDEVYKRVLHVGPWQTGMAGVILDLTMADCVNLYGKGLLEFHQQRFACS
jgi:PRP38 family